MRIRVDPATNLPDSLAMDADDGHPYTASFDYPELGPADIYDLGVPRTAKVVERLLSGDVARVVSGLKAGRRQFDDYCGFVVEERLLPTNYFPRVTVYRVWRKGPKWRIEQLRPERPDWAPPPDVDLAWWKERQDGFTFVPSVVCDGKEYWFYYLADSWMPGMPVPKPGAPTSFGQSVGPNQLSGPADDPVLPFWCQDVLPEQAGHPSAGIGEPDHNREFLVDAKPSSGPQGTILLRGRDTKPVAAETPDHFRLWLDPQANYLALKWELRVAEPSHHEKFAFIASYILEAVGKSPEGFSYPTRSRQVTHNGQHEVVRKFFIDFQAQVPEELFEPLK
jgi:hypothetical protein